MNSEKTQPLQHEENSEHEDKRLLQIISDFEIEIDKISQSCTIDDSKSCEIELKISLNKQEFLKDEVEMKLLEIISEFELRSEMLFQCCTTDSKLCEVEFKISLDKQKKSLQSKCFAMFSPCPRGMDPPGGCVHEINCLTRQLIQ